MIKHQRKKPEVTEDILNHFSISDNERIRIAMIGDRMLSDIVMGNFNGYFTIYVSPFDISKENFMVKLVRKVESKLL